MVLMRRAVLAAAAVALAGGTVPTPADAQVIVQTARARGWVGVSLALDAVVTEGRGDRTTVRITAVDDGSPAQRAGLRAGDLLVSLNERPIREGFRSMGNLRAGDPVEMVVERNGRRSRIRLVAAPLPSRIAARMPTVRADSVVEFMYREMDSLRVALHVRPARGTSSTRSAVALPEPPDRRERGTPTVVVGSGRSRIGQLSEVRPPFGFFVFHREEHDSLRAEMERLNAEIRELRSLETRLARVRRDRERERREGQEQLRAELVRLESRREEALRRSAELTRAMESAARESAAREAAAQGGGGGVTRVGGRWTMADAPARPLTPYFLGENRAAGAEVVDLRPELASYFQVPGGVRVESGVLVVDVPAGTLAQVSGLEPGDVIVGVDDVPVGSVLQLRGALGGSAPRPALSVVRKGRRVEVALRR